ncbi:MAG TPA: SDR family oxidoreductase, partial [Polyangiaceae bacterium]
ALVTGASSGIGAALARRLAERKYDCVLSARRVDRLEALARELEEKHGVKAYVVAADLGTREGARTLLEKVGALGVTIDFVANNAGFGVYGPFATQSIERVHEMIELNMVSLTTITHHFVKEMIARKKGHILEVASIGAYQPSPLYAVYAATKAYVLSFSAAVNYELRDSGVSVTAVSPGLTATEFHDVAEHEKGWWMRFITMTADDVAVIAIRNALAGRSVVTTGLMNKLMAVMVKLIPRRISTAVAELTMRSA